jgi:hypothetical protein
MVVARFLELPGARRAREVADRPCRGAGTHLRVADALNFSRDFLELAQHLVVTRGDRLGWSDWGTPEAIERTFAALGLTPPWQVARTA